MNLKSAVVTQNEICICTRGSKLAVYQANQVASKLNLLGFKSKVKIVRTEGDKNQVSEIASFGGKGVFVRSLQKCLLKKEADVAVHSLKDLPVETPEGLKIVCFLERDFPRDILILNPETINKRQIDLSEKILGQSRARKTLEGLTIATGSLRRKAFLNELACKVRCVGIRGNVDTRLRKLIDEKLDGIILSEASLYRLNKTNMWEHFILDPQWFVPSPGQGVVAVEMRQDDSRVKLVEQAGCQETFQRMAIERLLLKRLGGDCRLPVGIHCNVIGESVFLSVAVLNPKTNQSVKLSVEEKLFFPYDRFIESVLEEKEKKNKKSQNN